MLIEGASSDTYVLTKSDLGKEIVCVATAARGTEHTGSIVSMPRNVPAATVGKPKVTVVSVTDTAVTLEFDSALSGNTGARYNAAVYDSDEKLTVSATSIRSPYTITGLSPENTYTVYVTPTARKTTPPRSRS